MKDEKIQDQGCGCGCDLKKEVEELVKEGQKPTPIERMEKKREVEAAFGKDVKQEDREDDECGQ